MLRDQLGEVDEFNQLVPLGLGLVSALARFEAAVVREHPSSGEDLEDEDPLVLAALGLLSFRRTLTRWIDEIAPEAPHAEALPLASPPTDPGDIAR